MKTKKTTDALEILRHTVRDDNEFEADLERARLHADVAQIVYDARVAAGLTQAELAKLVGTSQSSIARIEDAAYEGHSLKMLQRIARALNKRVEVSLV